MSKIYVIGNSDLAEAVSFGLIDWGHTVSKLIVPTMIDESVNIAWLAADTPVSSDGETDSQWLDFLGTETVARLRPGALLIVSTQVPVGYTATLIKQRPDLDIVCIPENLRQGRKPMGFIHPDVIAVGAPGTVDRKRITGIYPNHLHIRMVWMSPESAEMSKHSINSFLSMSIAFAAEMDKLCQASGANYADVEKVLRLDHRIGASAYVSAGKADGRHLLRDLRYLAQLSANPRSSLLNKIIEVWYREDIGQTLLA